MVGEHSEPGGMKATCALQDITAKARHVDAAASRLPIPTPAATLTLTSRSTRRRAWYASLWDDVRPASAYLMRVTEIARSGCKLMAVRR